MRNPTEQDLVLHASCVALDGRAVLITGRSGSGKSGLALQLMAYGATLVSDDRTILRLIGPEIAASPPDAICGLIEARGVGILQARFCDAAVLRLVVDLDQTERRRLPERRAISYLGHSFPLLHKADSPHFASAILQYLKVEQGSAR